MRTMPKGTTAERVFLRMSPKHLRRPTRSLGVAGDIVDDANGEVGSSLILALIFLVAVSLVVAALATLATNDLKNTAKFQSSGARLYAAGAATDLAMRSVRYTYESTSAFLCPGTTSPVQIDGYQVEDWCVLAKNISGTITREVTFYACRIDLTVTAPLTGPCSGSEFLLTAVVDYDDNSTTFNPVANCSAASTTTCGAAMTVVSWKST